MKIRKYFELNINENTISKLVIDAKDLLGGKVRALNERRKIRKANDLSIKKLEKEQENKLKTE